VRMEEGDSRRDQKEFDTKPGRNCLTESRTASPDKVYPKSFLRTPSQKAKVRKDTASYLTEGRTPKERRVEPRRKRTPEERAGSLTLGRVAEEDLINRSGGRKREVFYLGRGPTSPPRKRWPRR